MTVEHASLAEALVAALGELTVFEAGRTAKIETNKGRDYSYKYADIAAVVKLTRPVLASHGLVALTPITDHASGLACTVILLHTSGERLDLGPLSFPYGRDAQATGSMITYHRRYALIAALGMAAGDDDDGAAAAPRQTQTRPEPRPFDLAAFRKACADVDVDPADVLVHAEIDKPYAALDIEDRPALLASLKELSKVSAEAGSGAVDAQGNGDAGGDGASPGLPSSPAEPLEPVS